MNLTCVEIEKLTKEAMYRYKERAKIFKERELAKKFHDLRTKTPKAKEFSIEHIQ